MAKDPMTTCKTCGKPMAANAKVCPSCGAKNKKPFYTRWWFWVIAAVLVLGAAGSAGGAASSGGSTVGSGSPAAAGGTSDTTAAAPTATPAPDLALQGEVTVNEDTFATYYEGVVVNNRDRAYSYVQITFTLYDADGNQLGTALDNISDLKAGGTWKFKAMALCDPDEIASWELSEIEGY